jgi:predicted acetyltransferase
MLTCDDDNPPSWRTIERAGGVLAEVVRDMPADSKPYRRYWLDLVARATTPS